MASKVQAKPVTGASFIDAIKPEASNPANQGLRNFNVSMEMLAFSRKAKAQKIVVTAATKAAARIDAIVQKRVAAQAKQAKSAKVDAGLGSLVGDFFHQMKVSAKLI